MNKLKEAKKQEKEADKFWADTIKNAIGRKCEICGNPEHPNAHHILPREHRATRYELWNGISLCLLHHKFSLDISPHRNAFTFFIWLKNNKPEQFKSLETYLSENPARIDLYENVD